MLSLDLKQKTTALGSSTSFFDLCYFFSLLLLSLTFLHFFGCEIGELIAKQVHKILNSIRLDLMNLK